MAARGGGDMDLGDIVNENVNTLSVSELIWSLKSAFQKSYFTEVESVLVSRELKLHSEIERKVKEYNLLRKEKDLLEEKHGMEMMEKLRVEKEFERCRRACIELKEANSRLTEVHVRLTGIAEDRQRVITELKRKNCDLEWAKSKAEIDLDVYKIKCEELEKDLEARVSRLEKELLLLQNREPLDPAITGVFEGVVGDKAKGDCVKVEADVSENVAGGPPRCVPEDDGGNLDPAGGPPSFVPEGGGRNMDTAGEKKMTENGKVETGINVGKKGEKLVGNEVNVFDCDVNVHLGTNAGPGCLSPESVHGDMANADSGRPLSENIIEIADSDDDSTPCEISSATKMAAPASMDSAHIGTENGAGVLKRKRALCVNKDENDDGSFPNNKMAKVQELIHAPNSSPVKHCSKAVTNFRTSNGGIDFTPTNPTGLMQSIERMGTDHKSQNINSAAFMDGSDSSTSSSSGSEYDSDFDFRSMTSSWQRGALNGAHERWVFEVHMINEFLKDEQLCMEAVCALYRQQIRGSSTSQNQGFGKLSNTRVSTLAKFLIDGDPKGKLKKSKEELMAYDNNGLVECRSIAVSHSKQLFEIYQKKEDALFLN